MPSLTAALVAGGVGVAGMVGLSVRGGEGVILASL